MKLNDYDLTPLRPEVERDGYGRYMLPNPEAPTEIKAYTRATTLAKAISDTYNLGEWSKRMIVQGLATEPTLLGQIDLMQDDRALRDDLAKVAEDAMQASGAHVARERGTQLHYYTEAADGGNLTLEQIPAEYRREVAAYQTAMREAGITVDRDSIERVLINMIAGVVGTADRVPVIMPNGMRLIADVKTGRDLSYSWAEICMQLAIYAHADAMLEYEDGEPVWGGMPVVEKHAGLVMHVPVDQGKCTLWLVDLAAGWQAVELAHEVREYRKRRNLATHLDIKAWQQPAASAAPGQPGESIPDGWEREPDTTTPVDPAASMATADVFGDIPVESDTAEAAALDMTPLDEVRRRFEITREAAAGARKAKRRRSKAQIAADELAEIATDGEPVVDVFENAITALTEAYELDGTPATEVAPSRAEHTGGTTGPSIASLPIDGEATVEGAPLSPDRKVTQPDGTVMTPAEGNVQGYVITPPTEANPFANMTAHEAEANDEAARRDLAITAIDAAPATTEGMGAVYGEFADVWTNELTDRGVERVQAHAATVHDALDHARTAADMAQVYASFSPAGWCDEFTEYGARRLGN